MDVYWFEQTQADVPDADDWLSANETQFLSRLHFPKRRADWLLGRWTAKNALVSCLGLPSELQMLRAIEIRASPSGAPEAFLGNQSTKTTLSLSHRAGTGACAVVPSRVTLGCDLEWIEPRSNAFASDYFVAEEQALIANAAAENRNLLLALLWSAKESALKALREGLRWDTRSVIVSLPNTPKICGVPPEFSGQSSFSDRSLSESEANHWKQFDVRTMDGKRLCGWWTESGGLLRTLVAAPPPNPPFLLSRACFAAQGRKS